MNYYVRQVFCTFIIVNDRGWPVIIFNYLSKNQAVDKVYMSFKTANTMIYSRYHKFCYMVTYNVLDESIVSVLCA